MQRHVMRNVMRDVMKKRALGATTSLAAPISTDPRFTGGAGSLLPPRAQSKAITHWMFSPQPTAFIGLPEELPWEQETTFLAHQLAMLGVT